jgi:hypothetical protein
MPMVSRQLAAALLQIMRKPEKNAITNAKKWGDAYADYAKLALAGPAIPQFIGAEAAKVAQFLQVAMKTPSPTSSNFALALANGVEAFWLLPPVVFTPPGGVGAVTLFPGKPALIAGLKAALSAPQPESTAAEAIAAQLDVASRTVTVTYTIPPGPPVITPIA